MGHTPTHQARCGPAQFRRGSAASDTRRSAHGHAHAPDARARSRARWACHIHATCYHMHMMS